MTDQELKIAIAIHEGAMKLMAQDCTAHAAVKSSAEAMRLAIDEVASEKEDTKGRGFPPTELQIPMPKEVKLPKADSHQLHDAYPALSSAKQDLTGTRFDGPIGIVVINTTREFPWTRRALYEVMRLGTPSETNRGESNYEWFNEPLDPEGVRRCLISNRFYPIK